MSSNQVISQFKKLSKLEQKQTLAELNLICKGKRRGKEAGSGKEFIRKMRNEIDESHAHGNYEPRDINNSTLNIIIRDAIDDGADNKTLADLEKIAYQGIIGWANAYGYLSEQDEGFVFEHLENFIKLIKVTVTKEEYIDIFNLEKQYLEEMAHDNFYSDYIFDEFERLTGLHINT